MRPTNHIFLAMNHVGKANDGITVVSGNFQECFIELVNWVRERSMAKRFDFVMARSEEECRAAFRLRQENGKSKLVEDDVMSQLMAMIADDNVNLPESE